MFFILLIIASGKTAISAHRNDNGQPSTEMAFDVIKAYMNFKPDDRILSNADLASQPARLSASREASYRTAQRVVAYAPRPATRLVL